MAIQITSPTLDQEEDTLSLCDLPIYDTNYNIDDHKTSNDESFEFFPSDCPTQDTNHVVFCGTLIPPGECPGDKKKRMPLSFRGTKGPSTANAMLGPRGLVRVDSRTSRSRLKWCSLVFGLQNSSIPKKMDVADIRDRLSRRSPRSLKEMFEKNISYNSNSKLHRGFSRLIRSLICRDEYSISVLN